MPKETAPQQTDANWPRDMEARISRIGEATMEVSIELGRARVPLQTILSAEPGDMIETEKLSGQPMEIMVNGSLFGRGEVVVVGDNLAIRVTDLARPDQR